MDLKFHEAFAKPIRGLFDDYSVPVEGFKDNNAELMKGHWIDTRHGDDGGKIYELFDENTEGEVKKELLQEWMCDNRLEVTLCVSITLNNHGHSYAEWFKYIDDCSGPDKLALYCLSRNYGVHTAVYNKSYVWMTMSNHLMLSDTEIFDHLAVCLIFLGQTKYGILHEIKQPSPSRMTQPTPSNKKPPSAQKGRCKTTCRSGTHDTSVKKHEIPTHGKKAHTLSESCSQQYGLPEPDATTPISRSRRRIRCEIDYLSLNDGPDEDTPETPKRRKKVSYPPSRKGPLAGQVAAQCVSSPEMSPKATTTSKALKGIQSLPAVPLSEVVSLSAIPALTGVPSTFTGIPVLLGIQTLNGTFTGIPVLLGIQTLNGVHQ